MVSSPTQAEGALQEARTWLARELHDGVVQRLTVMVVEMELMKRQPAPKSDLDSLLQTARAAVSDLRRVLCDLRQEPAWDSGFTESINEIVMGVMNRSGIAVQVAIQSCPDQVPRQVADNLRGIVGEALSNVRRHSGAERVTVTLQVVDDALAVTVADDGGGIQPAGGTSGFGVRGMRERALLLGGRVTLDSPGGRGTTMRCVVPLARLR